MEFGAEFFVLVGFIVFLCLLGYLGAHRYLLARSTNAAKRSPRNSSRPPGCAPRRLHCWRASRRRSSKPKPTPPRSSPRRAPRPKSSPRRRSSACRFRRPPHPQAEAKIALAELQAAAEVRAAAADFAAKAAEIVLRQETQGAAGAELAAREIAALKDRLN